jgi:rhodanese-related sulfurtransferase
VYSRRGNRAARAKELLLGAGYGQVSILGGIEDWYRQ